MQRIRPHTVSLIYIYIYTYICKALKEEESKKKERKKKMEVMGSEGSYGGDAMYCLIIIWLSIISWILSTCSDEPEASRKRRNRALEFIGATGF